MVCLRSCALEAMCNCFLVCLVFLSIQEAAASSLFKRDTPLATVNIPLTINRDKRYVAGVNMSTSPVQQSFKFALTANTGYSAVAGVSCDGCDGVPTYNASASSSQRAFPGSANITVGSAPISGPFIKENCSLHEADGTAWQYPNQTIIVAHSSSSIFSDMTSGLLGLGTNANGLSGDFYDTVFGGWLVRNPSRNNFSFGMDLRPPVFTSDDDEGNGGVLHWVVPDSSAFQGNIAWSTASVSAGSANAPASSDNVSDTTSNAISGFELPETDWSIELDGWAASISGTAVANSSKAQALIEPFFPDIFFPVSQANLFYAAIPAAVKINSFVSGAQAWTIPCDTSVSVAFSFGGQVFPLDQTQLVERQSDGTCVGTIKAWPDESVTNFLFGSSFISSLYLIFVIGRPGSGNPNAIGMALRATSGSGTPVGAIVGGTVGGVALVAILVVGAYLFGRRHRKKASQSVNVPAPSRVDEKDMFMASRKEEGSDEDGAQYANYPISHRGPLTTPLSADSTRPLLPEAQSPQSPALSVPNTPHSLTDFLAMSSGGASPRVSHVGEPSAASVGSRISYNPQALGATISASRGASPYPAAVTGVDTGGRMMTVEPFVLPPAPTSTMSGTPIQKVTPSASSHPEVHNPQIQLQAPQPNDHPASPQDIDPLASSTASSAAEPPFILSPDPQNAMLRANVTVPNDSRPSRAESESPAPPYTAQAPYTTSPTLVETSRDSAAEAHSQQQHRNEKA